MTQQIKLRVKRQDGPDQRPRWESFKLPYRPHLNIISVLMEIQRNPVNAAGERTTPVVWECNCLEEVCGACTMNINGKARPACSALIDDLRQPIILEPLHKFPIVRDLIVDRQILFTNLMKVKAWIPIDGTFDLGPGPRFPEEKRRLAYELSRCMTCGCCAEACPQFNRRAKFIGPAAISQVRLFNAHPTGAMHKRERLEALLDAGGIADCGNAQNCVRVCPKGIPLTASIAALNREANSYALGSWLQK
ncbi:MAG TPA: succinate dehydrogenase iron-sulfur subunit [Desulfobacteria bacterium]|nr:succinate dehydrogenase iron-sulfur subunit [Desulfobacteria bacterium]